ncbi:MAG: helicase-associated domain-containing protein, partial [Ornithinimicrobium sp.]
ALDHVLVQADLTAIAPGRLGPAVQSVMRLISDVESRGGATVHRITEASVRRALDAGWSADRLLTEIAAVSRTGVPQPLEYLVRDVARRHGVARVGTAACYVRSDDGALLDRVAADRGLALLRFRRLAPTVLISPTPAATVVDVLREHDYAPLAEGADGGVALVSNRHHRTARRVPDPVQVSGINAEVAAQIVSSMRQGERVRVAHPDDELDGPIRTADPVVTASVLREAAVESLPTWIGYVDDVGSVRRLLIRPHRVEAGRVLATVGEADQARTLLLHRITGARLAQ